MVLSKRNSQMYICIYYEWKVSLRELPPRERWRKVDWLTEDVMLQMAAASGETLVVGPVWR